MKFRMRIMITLFIVAVFLQACSCTKKETKKVDESAKETTAIETTIETIESKFDEQEETMQETSTQEIEIQQATQSYIEEEIINLPKETVQTETNPQVLIDEPDFSDDEMPTPITRAMAKKISVEHAGCDINGVTFIKAKQKYEDEIVKWDIVFVDKNNIYYYEINAFDGNVINSSIKTVTYNQVPYLPHVNVAVPTLPSDISNSASTINLKKAINIALNNAGFNIANVVFTKTKYRFDNDMPPRWEIEFTVNNLASNYKYSYVINAIDSTIISAWVE